MLLIIFSICKDTIFLFDMILDRYKVMSHIGNGAFGKVYRCYDTKHNRIIALKTGDTSKPRS